MPTTQTDLAAAAGSRIRGLLAASRVTQTQLAAHLGLSQTAISRRLRGEIAFDLSELEAVGELLGVPVARLIQDAA